MVELTDTNKLNVANKIKFILNKLTKHKAFIYVITANLVSLVIGAALSFLIPYLLNVDSYGYYRQFTLYLSYVGLLHFGFNDGIYLEYGAYNYEDLNKYQFRRYFRYLLFQQLITSIILLIIIYSLFKDQNRLFIFSFVTVNMIFLNLAKYFSYISQITRRFVLYSISYLIEKTSLIIPLLFLFLFEIRIFQYLIICQTFISVLLLTFFILIYKDIIFGHIDKENKKGIRNILALGLPLMLGNFIIIMIFNIDRVMIDILFPIKEFSIYSLAVNFLSIILVFITSLSTLLYPYLKRLDENDCQSYYHKLSTITTVAASLALIVYFPIKYIIIEFLPHYKESISIFAILLPGVILRGEIEIVFNNLFKSLKKQKVYFIISIFILILSIILNIVFYYLYKSIYAFAYATLITFICWYIISDLYFVHYFKALNIKKYFYLSISIICFFILTNLKNYLSIFIIYLCLSIMLFLIFYLRHILITFKQ